MACTSPWQGPPMADLWIPESLWLFVVFLNNTFNWLCLGIICTIVVSFEPLGGCASIHRLFYIMVLHNRSDSTVSISVGFGCCPGSILPSTIVSCRVSHCLPGGKAGFEALQLRVILCDSRVVGLFNGDSRVVQPNPFLEKRHRCHRSHLNCNLGSLHTVHFYIGMIKQSATNPSNLVQFIFELWPCVVFFFLLLFLCSSSGKLLPRLSSYVNSRLLDWFLCCSNITLLSKNIIHQKTCRERWNT